MKLAFTTLLLAGAELALLASVGSAYSTFASDTSNIVARDVGYGRNALLARSAYASELSDFSTRSLVQELENRLVRRESDADAIKRLTAELSVKGLKDDVKKALRTQLKQILAKAVNLKPMGGSGSHGSHAGSHNSSPVLASDSSAGTTPDSAGAGVGPHANAVPAKV